MIVFIMIILRFGIAAKYVFEDTNLLGTPVSNLEMLF